MSAVKPSTIIEPGYYWCRYLKQEGVYNTVEIFEYIDKEWFGIGDDQRITGYGHYNELDEWVQDKVTDDIFEVLQRIPAYTPDGE